MAENSTQATASPSVVDAVKEDTASSKKQSGLSTKMILGGLIVILVLIPFVLETLSQGNYIIILTRIGTYLILALGLNILVGYAGQLDFGRIAFLAVGAYAGSIISAAVCSAMPAAFGGFTFIVTILAGILGAVILGGILSVAVMRLRGDYLTIVTLGMAEIVRFIAINNPFNLTHGAGGFPKNSGLMNPIGLNWLTNKIYIPVNSDYALSFSVNTYWYLLVLVFVILAIVITRRQENSRTGRAWAALKDDEIAGRAMGINTIGTKTSAIMMSAIWGGVAGALFACVQAVTSPDTFVFFNSILVLAIVVIGGMGSTKGVIVGSFVIYGTPELIRAFAGERGLPFLMWRLTAIEFLILLVLIAAVILAAIFIKGKNRRLAVMIGVGLIVAELIRATIMGPIGAPLSETVVSAISNYRNLVLGLLMVIMMAIRPEGIIPMVRPKRSLTPEAEAKLAQSDHGSTPTEALESEAVGAGDAV